MIIAYNDMCMFFYSTERLLCAKSERSFSIIKRGVGEF